MGKNKTPMIGLRVSQELYDWIKASSEDSGSNPNAFLKSLVQKAMDDSKGYTSSKDN